MELAIVGEECAPPPDVKVAFYRIAQETLNNVSKHAGASQVWLSLRCEPGGLALTIHDNGRGFLPEQVAGGGLGLGIMRERADAIGAMLAVESDPGEGTEVGVRWGER